MKNVTKKVLGICTCLSIDDQQTLLCGGCQLSSELHIIQTLTPTVPYIEGGSEFYDCGCEYTEDRAYLCDFCKQDAADNNLCGI